MAQAHETTASRHITRRVPNTHSDAVQEAKRLEKMQSHASSHGGSGQRPAPVSDADTRDAAN